MTKNSKIAVVAGLGAIAGGVAGYYLNSDKGREQLQKASETIKEQSAKAISYASDMAGKAKTVAADLTSKAQQAMSLASNKAEQVKENVAESAQGLQNKGERTVTNGFSGVNA